ncbi:hypothetical protein JCM3770_000198 [Rhodotorula araucariae]
MPPVRPVQCIPLPALHAISLYTTLSSRRALNATLAGSGSGPYGRGAQTGSGGPLEVRVVRDETVSYDDVGDDGSVDDLEKENDDEAGAGRRRARAAAGQRERTLGGEKAYEEV